MIKANGFDFLKIIQEFQDFNKRATQKAANASIPEIEKQIQISFRREKAPSDKNWAPLKRKTPVKRKILRGLEGYFSINNPSTGRVHVTNDKYYTKFHYTGTKKMADRRFLPFPGEPVPRWEKEVAAKIDKAIRTSLIKMLGGK